jgi:hypothetical protein
VLLDLAIQAAGCISLPVAADLTATAEILSRAGAKAWLGDPVPGDIPAFPLPEPISNGGRRPGQTAGGVLVEAPPTVGLRVLEQADLLAAASEIQSLLSSSCPREIAVLAPPLSTEANRRFLAWATVAGAALVLEPDPAALAVTAAWVRPTIFLGDPAALRRVLPPPGRLARTFRRRPPLPFGRLHTLLVSGSPELAPDEKAFWADLGVHIIPLPMHP